MKYGLILLFSLIITGQFTFGQSKYATINLAEFDIDPESSLEDGEVEPNLLIFFDPLSTANDFRLEFINGQISSVQLSMQLNFGGSTYEMEISGGAIYDETDTQISQSAINITDNLFFTIDDNTLYYVHNDLIIASKTVAPSGPVTFSLTNLANVDADIWVSISDGCIAMDDDDGDGVCNIFDICPNGNDNIDTDGDGIPDDCDPSCGLSGTPCDDGNPGTINDIYDNNCNCNGTIELSDCNLYDLEENSLGSSSL